jgi:hypothetical protein
MDETKALKSKNLPLLSFLMSLTIFGAILRLSAFARADMAIPNDGR